jgi:hypothetical protein
MKEALLNYKTNGMAPAIASAIVELVKKSKVLTFPLELIREIIMRSYQELKKL